MAISTYSELKSAIADELNRSDLTAVIPNFISLAEARLNRDLRVRQMIKRSNANTVAGSRYLAIPPDWQQAKNLQITASGRTQQLEYMTLDFSDYYNATQGGATGIPKYYNFTGGEIELIPTPNGVYSVEMAYYGKVTPLSDTTTTNWLLTQWPDIYLYGALIHSAPYLKEDERIDVWSTIYDRLTNEVNASDERAQYSGSILKARTRIPY